MFAQTQEYSFPKPLMMVHQCVPVLEGGLLILHQAEHGKDALSHYDAHSKLVFSHHFHELVDALTTPTDHEAVVLLTSKNKIFTVDLRTGQVRLHNFLFAVDTSCQARVEAFCETSLLCIAENGRYNHPLLRLTYVRWPWDGEGRVSVFESQEGDWSYEFTLRRANSHSMMAWSRSRHDEDLELRIYDLRTDPRGLYRTLRVRNTLGSPQFALTDVFEIRPHAFWLVGIRECEKAKRVVSNLVWEVQQERLREARFELPEGVVQLDNLSCGQFLMLGSLGFEEGKAAPGAFFRCGTEEAVAHEDDLSGPLRRWVAPAYSNCLFAEARHDLLGVEKIGVRTRLMVTRRMQSWHLLMQSQWACLEGALLQEALGLLDYT